MIIRPFTLNDIPVLLAMGHMAHEESEYRKLSFSSEKCEALCKQIIEVPGLYGIVAETACETIGVLVAGIAPAYFSEEPTASDLLVYVLPEYRGSRAFYMMCLHYVVWAKEHGAKLIFLRTSTGIAPKKTGELYKRMGFNQIGGIYRMEA